VIAPLFPVPWSQDVAAGRWGASGNERILVCGELERPSRQARQFAAESLALGRGDASLIVVDDDLDEQHLDLVVRAWLAAHRARCRGPRPEMAEPPHEFLEYHVIRPKSYPWRQAVARWLHRLVTRPAESAPALDAFGPREYVRAMCELLGAEHPFSHQGPDGDAIAAAWGLR
jgi:hypothetical protein